MHPGLIKYERLVTFCFFCGRIGHRFRNCEGNKEKVQGESTRRKYRYPIYCLVRGWMGGVDFVVSTLIDSIPNLQEDRHE